MNVAYAAFKAGTIRPLLHIPHISYEEQVEAALNILEGIEAFRRSLPWYKRWAYCIGSAIQDLRELADNF